MDTDQLVLFGQSIRANPDPDVQAWIAANNHEAIAGWYNREADPNVWVFRSAVTRVQLVGSMDWANEYAVFKEHLQGINTIINANDTYDPRSVESRNALNSVFAGAGVSKSQILAISVREALEVEVIFVEPTTGPGGGNGSDINNAALAIYEGEASSEDVRLALLLVP